MDKTFINQLVLVIGAHRAGTSLVAKAVEVTGADLGDDLLPPASDNPKGFMEDRQAFSLNEALLDTLNLYWDAPTTIYGFDPQEPELSPYRDKLHALLTKRRAQANTFCVKDPRLCVLLPFWLCVVDELGLNVQFVISLRSPLDVANSLSSRNHFSTEKGLRLWLNWYYAALTNMFERPEKKVFVSYNKLLSDTEQEIRRLGRELNQAHRNYEVDGDKLQDFVATFVDQSLRHHQADQSVLEQQCALHGLDQVLPVYNLLSDFCHGRWSKQKIKKLLSSIPRNNLEYANFRAHLDYFKKERNEVYVLNKKVNKLIKSINQKELELQEAKNHMELKHDLTRRRANLECLIDQYKEMQRKTEEDVKQLSFQIEHDIEHLRRQHTDLLDEHKVLQAEREFELRHFAEKHQQEIQQLQFKYDDLSLSYEKLKQNKDLEIAELRFTIRQLGDAQEKFAQKTEEDIRQIVWQRETEVVNLENDLTAVQASLSYKLGRLITWPARKGYDLLFEPGIKHTPNLTPATNLLFLMLRHPVKIGRLINRERVRNAYITFFKKPGTARGVVDYYQRMVGRTTPALAELYSPILRSHSVLDGLPKLEPQPKVSVLIVNYNGQAHLLNLLDSLRLQTYRNFEVIIVDNCSQDNSVEWMKLHYPEVRVISLQQNLGFAAGNNIASEVATGNLYCLLNNDTEIETDCLERLVGCMTKYPNAGIVGPKILFWKKFLLLQIRLDGMYGEFGNIEMDVSTLEESARVYPKIFYKSGFSVEKDDNVRRVRIIEKWGELLFPVCQGQHSMDLNLRAIGEKNVNVKVYVKDGPLLASLEVASQAWKQASVDLSAAAGAAAFVINNAASTVTTNGDVFDRGFGELDAGQFDRVEKVDALCGCAMLVRPEALAGRSIFADQLFAYFEDTDLSLRIRQSGFELIYYPRSVIYHKHASTSKENSAFFRFHVNRNRVLFYALHFSEQFWKSEYRKAQLHLNHLRNYYTKESVSQIEKEFAVLIPQIFADWNRLLPAIRQGSFYNRERFFPTIGIYNNFWYTLGGAEHHAGVMAQRLQRYGLVDLISENEFSIVDIESKFNLNLKGCRKRLVTALEIHHNPKITQEYSLFINSTFGSDLKCHCPVSFYVVSFPYNLSGRSKENKEFIHSYTNFLCNSHYTLEWTRHYWGVSGEVLYPSVSLPEGETTFDNKERIILNVGRFFNDGHCKKQLELVKAFIALQYQSSRYRNWRLVLVGNVSPEHMAYFQAVKQAAAGYSINVFENLAFEKLQALYRKAAIYWHATGLEEDLRLYPDRYEHFGITTVEAMGYGCVPVVINGGGQAETVEEGVTGFLFNNIQELSEKTQRCIELFEEKSEKFWAMAERAIRKSHSFERTSYEKTLERIVVQHLNRLPNGRLLN